MAHDQAAQVVLGEGEGHVPVRDWLAAERRHPRRLVGSVRTLLSGCEGHAQRIRAGLYMALYNVGVGVEGVHDGIQVDREGYVDALGRGHALDSCRDDAVRIPPDRGVRPVHRWAVYRSLLLSTPLGRGLGGPGSLGGLGGDVQVDGNRMSDTRGWCHLARSRGR